jgi:hypothetical protein
LIRPRWLRRPWQAALLGALLVLGWPTWQLPCVIWWHGDECSRQCAAKRPADAALVLGSRAYLDGKPHPCLTGASIPASRSRRPGW